MTKQLSTVLLSCTSDREAAVHWIVCLLEFQEGLGLIPATSIFPLGLYLGDRRSCIKAMGIVALLRFHKEFQKKKLSGHVKQYKSIMQLNFISLPLKIQFSGLRRGVNFSNKCFSSST